MKIAIIGAGAMGSLYGAYLGRNREKVWLNDVWEDHVTYIHAQGLSVVSPEESFVAHPKATTMVTDIGKVDLIIICMKSNYTAEAALIAEVLAKPDSVVLTIQNGLGNAEQLAEIFGAERVLIGETGMGSSILEPGHIMHGGLKTTHIGAFTGESDKLEDVVNIFNRSGLPAEITANAQSLLWSRLVVQAGINAVTAVSGITNGELLHSPYALKLAEMVVAEAKKVARAAGIPLLYDDPAVEMHEYAKSMMEHHSPMLQDVMHHRHTEIDATNGMIVREGRRLGVATPVNESLYLSIKTIDSKVKG